MGYNDRWDRCIWEKRSCPKCGSLYECREETQEPGSRSKDYERCPYCKNINNASMEYEFFVRKIHDD